MATRKYMLFVCENYYPRGGFDDLVSIHDTYEEALEALDSYSTDWAQIVDVSDPEKIKIVNYTNNVDFFYRHERAPEWVVDENA